MTMWKLEQEEYYFHVLDSRKQIAGYFDPDYGDIHPKGKEEEIIDSMWRNHDMIPGGHLMVGLAKFGIFNTDYNSDIPGLEGQIDSVRARISKWKEAILREGIRVHYVGVSHTDQDMLTITFPVRFERPVPLDRKEVRAQLEPILDRLRQQDLI